MRINESFLEAILNQEPVVGHTHDFYRYPARFSPTFVRAAIETFTSPGDAVFDPFMGGGTTLVEAQLLGRNAVGCDISSLAVFVAQSKLLSLTDTDISQIHRWIDESESTLNLRNHVIHDPEWDVYQTNIHTRETWVFRKFFELALASLKELRPRPQRFVRAVLLRTGQWALDCRDGIPSANELRRQVRWFGKQMVECAIQFRQELRSHLENTKVFCINRSAVGIEHDDVWKNVDKPRLVLTSPPYPGVHVLYHRWQIRGRRETPAPFWLAGTTDGAGASFYTMGDRKELNLSRYFDTIRTAFQSAACVAKDNAIFVQMVAFADRSWQLPRYLEVLASSGFREITFPEFSNSEDSRIWRTVPNRKWYATIHGDNSAGHEVVLFHQVTRKQSSTRL